MTNKKYTFGQAAKVAHFGEEFIKTEHPILEENPDAFDHYGLSVLGKAANLATKVFDTGYFPASETMGVYYMEDPVGNIKARLEVINDVYKDLTKEHKRKFVKYINEKSGETILTDFGVTPETVAQNVKPPSKRQLLLDGFLHSSWKHVNATAYKSRIDFAKEALKNKTKRIGKPVKIKLPDYDIY